MILHFTVFLVHAADDSNAIITQRTLPGKVRGSHLPQEYELSRFIADVDNTDLSWNTSTPACEWEGVICNEHLKVTRICWGDKGLTGMLQWEYLSPTLHHCRIWRNKLTGNVTLNVLPSQLVQLRASHNAFKGSLDFIHMPHTLEWLTLHGNQFTGSVDLTQLPPRLTHFFLRNNNFSGSIDFTRWPSNLNHISLSNNFFTGPLELQHLPSSLQILECDNNLFSGLVMFENLPDRLRVLSLKNNAELNGAVDLSKLPVRVEQIHINGTQVVKIEKRKKNHESQS